MQRFSRIAFLVLSSVFLSGCWAEPADDSVGDKLQSTASDVDAGAVSVDKTKQADEIQDEVSSLNYATQGIGLYGEIGKLGTGYLAYGIGEQEGEDYKLYFLESENAETPLSEADIHIEEADCIFPDVREGNAAIGKFLDIYFLELADLTGDGSAEVLVIARYEKDGETYFDTRVYGLSESSVTVEDQLIQELNEKYRSAEEYPVEEVLVLPHA